jgi:hypothetical protein
MNWSAFKNRFVVLLSILTVFLLILNAYYVWNWGDDYLIKYFYQSKSPLGYLWNDYLIFDGRSLNPGYLISRYCLALDFPYLSTIFASILLLITSAFLVMIIKQNNQYNFYKDFVPTVVVTVLLWLALFNSLNEILYWQTGMLYMVELFLIVALYLLLLKGDGPYWLLILLAFLTGMSSPNAVLAYLFVLSIEAIYLKEKKASQKRYKYVIAALFIGFLLVVLSPGSRTRWEMQGGADAKALGNIYELYFRIQQMLTAFIDLNTIIIWFMIAFALMFIMVFSANKKDKPILDYLFDFRWLIAALISIGFYFPKMSYYIQTSRLNCHFVLFSVLFYVTQLSILKVQQPALFTFQVRYLKIPLLIVGCLVIFSQVLGSRHCLNKLKVREQLYLNNKGKDMVLKANDIIGPPRTKWFTDVHEDSSHIFNKTIADFYGLKSIRKEKYR